MQIRFYIDPETQRPHVENHGVETKECAEVLETPGQDFASSGGARVACGQTRAGRYLKVIYKEDDRGDGLFVITAYPLSGNELRTYRRRIRRRSR